MKKSYLVKTLEDMNQQDVYSLILFALFQLKDDEKYSALSTLAFILDKEHLFNLISVFGGMTITIPTSEDLKLIVCGLLIYEMVNLEDHSLESTLIDLKGRGFTEEELKNTYLKICRVMEKYDFSKE